jgi:proline iminopeptidase
MKRQEGFIAVPGGNVWYEIAGDKKTIPLITLHGGPGFPHDSLESLIDLTNERNVIFYDQLGCGNSRRTTDKSLWTVEYFVAELQLVVKYLKLKKYHILGHSWGSALAGAFALTRPAGLQSIIFTDPYISTPYWKKDAKRLMNKLSHAMQKAVQTRKTDSKEYKEARNEYYLLHVDGAKKRPVACMRASNKMNRELYNYMWGPAEFDVSGTLKTFDLVPRLKEIKIPVLLLCGRFDEATPEALAFYASELPNAKMKVFEKSAHMPHWTERKAYMTVVRKFLLSIP